MYVDVYGALGCNRISQSAVIELAVGKYLNLGLVPYIVT